MRLLLGTFAGPNNSECQLLLFCRAKKRIFSDGLTSEIAGVQSDGFNSDQDFVLFQFWDGNLFENYVFTLALW